jgi:hypothetical protein
MINKIFKKEIYPYYFAILGGFVSFYFTLNTVSINLNSKLLTISLFILCFFITLCFIYLIQNKLKYRLNELIAFTFILLVFGSMLLGYKLGWTETFIFPIITSLVLTPYLLFLLKRPNNIIKGIFWLFLTGILVIIFFNSNNFLFSRYCEIIRKGQSDMGNCYPKNDYSITKNILNIKINHPEIGERVGIKLSKRNGENIIGKTKEIYMPQEGDLNNKIEAFPKKIVTLPSSNKFTMPFSTISKSGDRNYYLGLFEMNKNIESISLFSFYKFYTPFTHLESEFIGKNITLDSTEIKDDGTINGIFQKDYKTIISQNYYENNSSEKQSMLITIDSITPNLMYSEMEN